MYYVIVSEKSKRTRGYPDFDGDYWWSHSYGCSKLKNATFFKSFEAAQPIIKQLRDASPTTFYAAVVSPLGKNLP